ncbi:hypothetical protein FPV67DRAFT_616575 [Lyophyllum atratum]|nr:hypothetical protein FPV67DRAFT_616575 [Lyophyllum atratum]
MPCIINAQTSAIPAVLLGLGTVCLLLSCLSAPIIDGVQVFRLIANIGGANQYVDVGIWGHCVVHIRGLVGFGRTATGECSRVKYGFTLDGVVTAALHAPETLQTVLHKGHTMALIVYPIATLFTLLSFMMLLALWLSMRYPKQGSTIGVKSATAVLVFNIFSTLLSFLAFFLVIAVVTMVKSKVGKINQTRNLRLKWGNVAWLTGIACIGHIYTWIFLHAIRKQAQKMKHARKHESYGSAFVPDISGPPAYNA